MGWCQLAAKDETSPCQCADGNVMRYANQHYRVLSLAPASQRQENVTADTVRHLLYISVNGTFRYPGRSEERFRVLVGNEAYCAQLCYSSKSWMEAAKESLIDVLIKRESY